MLQAETPTKQVIESQAPSIRMVTHNMVLMDTSSVVSLYCLHCSVLGTVSTLIKWAGMVKLFADLQVLHM